MGVLRADSQLRVLRGVSLPDAYLVPCILCFFLPSTCLATIHHFNRFCTLFGVFSLGIQMHPLLQSAHSLVGTPE